MLRITRSTFGGSMTSRIVKGEWINNRHVIIKPHSLLRSASQSTLGWTHSDIPRCYARVSPTVMGLMITGKQSSSYSQCKANTTSIPGSTIIRALHATPTRAILPPLPQHIEGTVNDPVPVIPTSPSHGSYHWTFERLVSILLIPLTITPFAAGVNYPMVDAALVTLIIVHSHMGFQACITDYFPSWRVPRTRKALDWFLNGSTLLALYGFYLFETNDVGLCETLVRVWNA